MIYLHGIDCVHMYSAYNDCAKAVWVNYMHIMASPGGEKPRDPARGVSLQRDYAIPQVLVPICADLL